MKNGERTRECNLFWKNFKTKQTLTLTPPLLWIFQTAFERRFNKIMFQLKDQPLKKNK